MNAKAVHTTWPGNNLTLCGITTRDHSLETSDTLGMTCKSCIKVYKLNKQTFRDSWNSHWDGVDAEAKNERYLASKKAKDVCENCDREIKIAIFRGGPYCSDDCRKTLGLDIV